MAKKNSAKRPTANATASPESMSCFVFQEVTIQEPQPGKFKIVPGNYDGIVWKCITRRSTTIENTKNEFLKSINKTSTSFLTQEQVDGFLKFVDATGFRVKMPVIEWKKNFARRFRRFLERKGITLEQIEARGFNDPTSKRWLRNLYRNGICMETNVRTIGPIHDLCHILGVESTSEF